MKKIFFLILMLFILISCDEKKKITNVQIVEVDNNISLIEEEHEVLESISIEFPEEFVTSDMRPPTESFEIPNEDIVIVNNNQKGTLTYKIDTILTIGVTSRVEARISRLSNDTISDYLVSISHKSSTGRIETTNIKVGNIMDMELVSLNGDAFDIKKLSPGSQPIEDDYIATWMWGLTPLKTGQYNLILRAHIKDNDLIKFENIFDEIITVENKPKKNYRYEFIIPDELKNFEEDVVLLNIYEDDINYNFQWGGDGKIVLDFDKNIKIEPNNNYYIEYNKSIFNYRWVIEPSKKGDLNYTLKIVGDYEEIILEEDTIKVKINLGESFNKFVDGMLKRWYFIFTTLLIPLYMFIKKKYFKKEEKKNT